MKKLSIGILFIVVLALALVVIRQRQRIDELWVELDAQRAWLHAIDDGTDEVTTGTKTEVRVRIPEARVR